MKIYIVFRFYLCMMKVQEGDNVDNGPKRRVLHHLGPLVSLFHNFFRIFCILTNDLFSIRIYLLTQRVQEGGDDDEMIRCVLYSVFVFLILTNILY
jgi:hypothetical protein